MHIVQLLLRLLYAYLAAGLLAGGWMVFRGASRIDPDLREASWRLRLLLLPGAAALWPLLLMKYFRNPRLPRS